MFAQGSEFSFLIVNLDVDITCYVNMRVVSIQTEASTDRTYF